VFRGKKREKAGLPSAGQVKGKGDFGQGVPFYVSEASAGKGEKGKKSLTAPYTGKKKKNPWFVIGSTGSSTRLGGKKKKEGEDLNHLHVRGKNGVNTQEKTAIPAAYLLARIRKSKEGKERGGPSIVPF